MLIIDNSRDLNTMSIQCLTHVIPPEAFKEKAHAASHAATSGNERDAYEIVDARDNTWREVTD